MSFSPSIIRRKTKQIFVGSVPVGGDAKIAVQSMTNTLTTDIKATVTQINALAEAGADIVRVSCPDIDSTKALKHIIKDAKVPIVADIHFHYKRAIEAADAGAHCLRINPGNIESIDKIREIVSAAKSNNASIRVGVNGGSISNKILEKYKTVTPEALVESATENIKILEDLDFFNFKLSVKASDVMLAVKAYELLSKSCDYPLHLGITEAGAKRAGTVKSSIGIGHLLMQGIGDTIRVSLSDDPIEEVRVGFDILKSLHLRTHGVTIISCPSCARQKFDVIKTVKEVEERLFYIKKPIKISIIGCTVNGPGEARESEIGVVGSEKIQVYIDGKRDHRIDDDGSIIDHIVKTVEERL